MENIKTPLGHVTMVPKGTYDSTTTYNRLDLVTYTDNNNLGVYVSKQDSLQNIPPSTTTAWMKLIDSSDTRGPQGDTGPAAHFEFIGSSITTLPYTEDAYVTINESGEDTAKNISFNFGIPKGEPGDSAGFGSFVANASQSDTPFARVSESGPNTAKRLSFEFGIPAGPTGAAAGFAAPTATIQALSTSEPTVSITTTGDNTNKKFIFDFGLPLIAPVVNPIKFELKGDQMRFGLFENGDDANVELGTAYSGNQVGITVTQYTQGFSQRQRTLTLLNSQGNTSIPGDLTIAGDLNLNKPLSVESGGTNINSNPSMIINLSSTQAANVFNTNPQPGVTGILPIAQGGTGASTSTGAITNLGITPTNIGALPLNPRFIELIPESGKTHGGYIDFHYGGDNSVDYTSRIIEEVTGEISIKGKLKISEPLSIASGGTSCTTAQSAANAFINALGTGDSNSQPNDYIITQYAGGTQNSYYRRPVSKVITIQNINNALANTLAGRWDKARDNAALKVTNGGSSYKPIIDMLGANGDWSIGKNANNTDDSLVFEYTPNAAYENTTNATYKILIPALTSATNNYIFTGKAVPASQEPQVGSALATNTIILVYEE